MPARSQVLVHRSIGLQPLKDASRLTSEPHHHRQHAMQEQLRHQTGGLLLREAVYCANVRAKMENRDRGTPPSSSSSNSCEANGISVRDLALAARIIGVAPVFQHARH